MIGLGRITYTTTLTSTPLMSPLAAADVFALADVFAETLALGGLQDIYLYWGYSKLDPYHTDQRNVSKSAAGVVEVSNFLSTKGFMFAVSEVVQDRAALVNEYAVMEALNEELMNGVVVTWYPDFDNYPAEYFSCIAEKRLDQKRINNSHKYNFNFDLMVLAAVQVPSTVPDFVMA